MGVMTGCAGHFSVPVPHAGAVKQWQAELVFVDTDGFQHGIYPLGGKGVYAQGMGGADQILFLGDLSLAVAAHAQPGGIIGITGKFSPRCSRGCPEASGALPQSILFRP